jgi:CDP-4-dehydro-6-deoxyglucose reductase, E1
VTRDELKNEIRRLVIQYVESAEVPLFKPGQAQVPPAGKVIGSRESELMVEAALDGWLTTGRFNRRFETQLAKFLGVKHVLTVNSGSSANLVAFCTLTSPKLGKKAIQPGDEVITVAAGFPTTVNPILQCGAVPVFVDVELGTYNVDVAKLKAALTEKTRAIMLAHTLGNPFNLAEVTDICRARGLWLIEDCCDALGSRYDGKLVGTFGDIATVSFYPAHHITMGEGGAVFTNDDQLEEIADSFRSWGRDCYCQPGRDNTCGKRFGWRLGELPEGYDHKYIYSHLGYNLKITDMQAACGVAQLERLDDFIQTRKDNFSYLLQGLKRCEEHLVLPQATPGSEPAWFGFPLTVSEKWSRLELLRFLDKSKIGTRLLFGGNLTRQPYMRGRQYRIAEELEVTDQIMERTFWVGLYPGLTQPMLEFTIDRLETFFEVGCRA